MRPVWQEKSGRNTKGRESEGTKKTRGQASEKIKCATTYLTLQVSRLVENCKIGGSLKKKSHAAAEMRVLVWAS